MGDQRENLGLGLRMKGAGWLVVSAPEQLPCVGAIEANEAAQELRSARSHESPNTNDLAWPDLEVDIVEHIGATQTADAEHRWSAWRRYRSYPPLSAVRTKH